MIAGVFPFIVERGFLDVAMLHCTDCTAIDDIYPDGLPEDSSDRRSMYAPEFVIGLYHTVRRNDCGSLSPSQ